MCAWRCAKSWLLFSKMSVWRSACVSSVLVNGAAACVLTWQYMFCHFDPFFKPPRIVHSKPDSKGSSAAHAWLWSPFRTFFTKGEKEERWWGWRAHGCHFQSEAIWDWNACFLEFTSVVKPGWIVCHSFGIDLNLEFSCPKKVNGKKMCQSCALPDMLVQRCAKDVQKMCRRCAEDVRKMCRRCALPDMLVQRCAKDVRFQTCSCQRCAPVRPNQLFPQKMCSIIVN